MLITDKFFSTHLSLKTSCAHVKNRITKLKESSKSDFSVPPPLKVLLLVSVSSGWRQPSGETLSKSGVNIPKTSRQALLSRSRLLNSHPFFFNAQFTKKIKKNHKKKGHVCSVKCRSTTTLGILGIQTTPGFVLPDRWDLNPPPPPEGPHSDSSTSGTYPSTPARTFEVSPNSSHS